VLALGGVTACSSAGSTSQGSTDAATDGGAPPVDGSPANPDGSIPDASGPDVDAAGPGHDASGSGDSGDAGVPAPNGPSGSWTLAWHDEFDGTSLDPANWNVGWLTGPKSPGIGDTTAVTDSQQSGTYFGPASLSFPGDGSLHIRLSNPVDPGAPSGFTTQESGLITTAGLWNLNPGSASYAGAGKSIDGTQAIEIRARLAGPASAGGAYWPAFWMTNAGNYNGGGESYSEEVDLLEGLGNGSNGSNLELHLHAASAYGGVSVVPASDKNEDFSLAYHEYTYVFSTTKIECYSDGTLVPAVAPPSTDVTPQWTVPQYLMLAFQATAGATRPTSATGTPNDLMIDYVRIWTGP